MITFKTTTETVQTPHGSYSAHGHYYHGVFKVTAYTVTPTGKPSVTVGPSLIEVFEALTGKKLPPAPTDNLFTRD